MKKLLGATVFCAAMLIASPVLFARDHDHDHGVPPGHYHGMHDQGRHEGWYKRGGHIPPAYRGSDYVVSDWRSYHLKAPPRGYHYIRSDNGDFLLTAITTGVIRSIVAANH